MGGSHIHVGFGDNIVRLVPLMPVYIEFLKRKGELAVVKGLYILHESITTLRCYNKKNIHTLYNEEPSDYLLHKTSQLNVSLICSDDWKYSRMKNGRFFTHYVFSRNQNNKFYCTHFIYIYM